MSAFNAINGVPATGNEFTLRRVLRDEWGFTGMVVSDYNSVSGDDSPRHRRESR